MGRLDGWSTFTASFWDLGVFVLLLSVESTEYFCTVVGDEPVVNVKGDKKGGETGDGDNVQNTGVVDQVEKPILK